MAEMPRIVQRLSARGVATKSKAGYHADGNGLYLQVSKSGAKSWVLRFRWQGRTREMGLGPVATVSLADAREAAKKWRTVLAESQDPIRARAAERAALQRQRAGQLTFDQCAEKYIAAHAPAWRNDKHVAQWRTTLKAYASPVFGALPVQEVDTANVMRCLDRIWREKTETASRVRGRVEVILDWAKAHGYRTAENPARWRGHLDKLLPKRSRVAKVNHHPALPYVHAPAFLAALRERDAIAARALEFVILTATRVGEAVEAEWSEIDLEAVLWTIPAARMKAGRRGPHRVPLSDAALAVLERMKTVRQGDHLFPGWRTGRPLSQAAVLKTAKEIGADLGHPEITVQGFRSTFRDWAAEQNNFPWDVAEGALAHVVADKVEAAYRRGDLLQRRAAMMKAWSDYLTHPRKAATVTPLRKRRKAQ